LLHDELPDAVHVACFDTAFHHDLPTRARLLPIPRRFMAEGVRRYGFHGLSYAYIVEELRRVEGEAAANGKVIIAHLGSGVSLAALQGGKSIDTTMSLTPASGVPMSTRSGDLDPGLGLYLSRTQGLNVQRFNEMVNFESGLLGISETTADMEKLLELEAADERAKDAVDVFCYQVQKSIGSLAAALGGLNTLVFTGGMGENAPKIRARVCEGLEFLGITLDGERNGAGLRLISADGSQTGVHVIPTDEAVTIARETEKLITRQ
jgi:acetate kinase